MSKQKEKTLQFEFRLPVKEVEFISEFPGYFRCALECNNGIVSEEQLKAVSEYIGDVGMCQVYNSPEGHLAVFCTSDRSVITTHRGVYTNVSGFHSIRSEDSLFVFEEDYSVSEEALCNMADVRYYYDQLKELYAIKKAVSIFNGFIEEH